MNFNNQFMSTTTNQKHNIHLDEIFKLVIECVGDYFLTKELINMWLLADSAENVGRQVYYATGVNPLTAYRLIKDAEYESKNNPYPSNSALTLYATSNSHPITTHPQVEDETTAYIIMRDATIAGWNDRLNVGFAVWFSYGDGNGLESKMSAMCDRPLFMEVGLASFAKTISMEALKVAVRNRRFYNVASKEKFHSVFREETVRRLRDGLHNKEMVIYLAKIVAPLFRRENDPIPLKLPMPPEQVYDTLANHPGKCKSSMDTSCVNILVAQRIIDICLSLKPVGQYIWIPSFEGKRNYPLYIGDPKFIIAPYTVIRDDYCKLIFELASVTIHMKRTNTPFNKIHHDIKSCLSKLLKDGLIIEGNPSMDDLLRMYSFETDYPSDFKEHMAKIAK